jgi:DNA repair exonuclease SbcCD ATPase subunit
MGLGTSFLTPPTVAVAKTTVAFALGDSDSAGVYELTRSFHPQTKDARKMTAKASLTCGGQVVHTGKTAVDQWVARHIGSSQSFVRACVVSQGGDEDYLKLDTAHQINVLDEAINLEPVNHLAGLFKAATLAHGAVLEALTTLHAHETLKLQNLQNRRAWAEDTLERYRALEERARALPAVSEEEAGTHVRVPTDRGALERERTDVLGLLQETGGSLAVVGAEADGGGGESYESLVASLRRVRGELANAPPPLPKPSIDKASLEDMRTCLEANRWAGVSEAEIKQRIERLDNVPFNHDCWACVAREKHEGLGVELRDELLEALDRIPQLRRTRQTLLEQSRLWEAYEAQCAAPAHAMLRKERVLWMRAHQACRERIKEIDRLLACEEHAEARAVRGELGALRLDHERACGMLLNLSSVQAELKSLAESIDFYKSRKDAIDVVAQAFAGYRRWLYETRVVPALLHKANGLIARATSQQLSLVAVTSEAAGNKLSIEWFFKHGPHQPPIGKASGFQRFIFSLALRIALAQLGGTPPASHLFIDEGFVACDSEHLAKVPTFLRALLGIYRGVVLFTHLEELKDAVDDLAQISRDASNHLSSICLV